MTRYTVAYLGSDCEPQTSASLAPPFAFSSHPNPRLALAPCHTAPIHRNGATIVVAPRKKSVRDFGGPAFFRDAYSGHSLTFGPESLPAAPPVANMPARMSVRLRALCPVETTGSPAGAPGLGSEPRRPSGRRGVVFICTRYLQARGIYRRYLPWSSPASAQDLIVHASVRLSRPLTVAERLFTGAYTSIARERGSFF